MFKMSLSETLTNFNITVYQINYNLFIELKNIFYKYLYIKYHRVFMYKKTRKIWRIKKYNSWLFVKYT